MGFDTLFSTLCITANQLIMYPSVSCMTGLKGFSNIISGIDGDSKEKRRRTLVRRNRCNMIVMIVIVRLA